MPDYRRVITLPLTLTRDEEGDDLPQGDRPERLWAMTAAVQRYLIKYRLPHELQDVTVFVEPRIRAEQRGVGNATHAELVMDLVLFTSGQLPLRFRVRRGEGPNASLEEEMDRLTEGIRLSLLQSNAVWVEGASIAANDPAPADELNCLRLKSGRQAPKRPPNSIVPALMQIAADAAQLPLVMPDVRPEYVEPLEVEIHVKVNPYDRQLVMTVSAIFGKSVPDGKQSSAHVGSRLRPRVPEEKRLRFVYLACNAGLLNIPLKLRGHVVVSMSNLKAKAFEISSVLNGDDVCGGLSEFTQGL